MLAHFTSNVAEDYMTIFELDIKLSTGECFHNPAVQFNHLFTCGRTLRVYAFAGTTSIGL